MPTGTGSAFDLLWLNTITYNIGCYTPTCFLLVELAEFIQLLSAYGVIYGTTKRAILLLYSKGASQDCLTIIIDNHCLHYQTNDETLYKRCRANTKPCDKMVAKLLSVRWSYLVTDHRYMYRIWEWQHYRGTQGFLKSFCVYRSRWGWGLPCYQLTWTARIKVLFVGGCMHKYLLLDVRTWQGRIRHEIKVGKSQMKSKTMLPSLYLACDPHVLSTNASSVEKKVEFFIFPNYYLLC